jgi:branched-chain amino acid transport system substrate-binding protein
MSLQILEAAVAKNGLDKEKIRAMVSKETFDTINGKVKFDGVQNTITPTAFVQFQKGKLQIIWPASIATSKFEAKNAW